MADYDLIPYEDVELFQEKNDSVTDLHAYYMSQFNLELENGKPKPKNDFRHNVEPKNDNFRFGVEESFDFEVFEGWNNTDNNRTDFELIDEVIDSNINDQNIKEVLLDLDNIEFDDSSFKSDSCDSNKKNDCNYNNDYIDDESLIDELCREDGESRLTPETFNDDNLKTTSNENLLPSIETAFSKRYCNYNNPEDSPIQQTVHYTNVGQPTSHTQPISSMEHYSYPNNILYNIDSENNYILPDTPTSCTEFNFDRNSRTVSVSDSVESDVNSGGYYDENSQNFDEDELFINLDDFGLVFERENEGTDNDRARQNNGRTDKDKSQEVNIATRVQNAPLSEKSPQQTQLGERVCLWEHCHERYPNQNTLVEHIERAHVNTYKGDEFSCLWRECMRARRPFNARYKLLIHMRVHSGHKPNRCHHPGCGKAFSRLENLKIHVRSHTGERPYACPAPHCRKAFSNSSDRAKHQRTHFNARPYACGAVGCGKRYTDPSSLRKHVKSHPHVTASPRPCLPPTRPIRRPEEQLVPSSPAKLTTLRCIRDKLTVPKLQRM